MIPNDIRYIHERAKAYQILEFHQEAIEDFSNVIRRNPKNAHAHFRRAFSLKAMGVNAKIKCFRNSKKLLRISKGLRSWIL